MKRLLVLIMAVCLLGGAGVSEARYIDNGDGTVSDTQTGLMWQQATAPDTYTWENAIAYCNNLVLADYTDWRLPNLSELESLVNRDHTPAIDPVYFPNTEYETGYWSSTSDDDDVNKAWAILFSYGYGYTYEKNVNMHVRAVRTRQMDNGSLTINIEPAEARNAGAQWRRVNTDIWYNSGDTETNIPIGTHTVELKSIDGWAKPSNFTVTVNADQTTTETRTYRYLPLKQCNTNDDCDGSNEYCAKSPGECETGVGQCISKPEACIMLHAPVCGCDWITYSNDCVAAGNGVNVRYEGECVGYGVLVDDDLTVNVSCVDVSGDKYSLKFDFYDELNWELDISSIGPPLSNKCQHVDEGLNLYVTCADYAGGKYGFTLMYDIGMLWELDVDTLRDMALGECD